MNYLKAFIFPILILQAAAQQGCISNIDDIPLDYPPVILKVSTTPGLRYSTTLARPHEMTFNHNEEAWIYCTPQQRSDNSGAVAQSNLLYKGNILVQNMIKPIPIKCDNGLFIIETEKESNLRNFKCTVGPSAYMKVRGTCLSGNILQFGLQIHDQFLKKYTVCFEENKLKTHWAHTVIEPSVNYGRQQYPPNIPNNLHPFYTATSAKWNIADRKEVFKAGNQRQVLRKLVGKKTDSIYMPPGLNNLYFGRGHLIARADMVYHHEQEITYFYQNILPMWQIINAGNWEKVEKYIRSYAEKEGSRLDVWVGGVGILQLKNDNGVEKDIWLYDANDANSKSVTAPKVLFKCIANELTLKSFCFLVVNNPHGDWDEFAEKNGPYNVCGEHRRDCPSNFKFKRNVMEGCTYCCSFEGFYSENRAMIGLETMGEWLSTRCAKDIKIK